MHEVAEPGFRDGSDTGDHLGGDQAGTRRAATLCLTQLIHQVVGATAAGLHGLRDGCAGGDEPEVSGGVHERAWDRGDRKARRTGDHGQPSGPFDDDEAVAGRAASMRDQNVDRWIRRQPSRTVPTERLEPGQDGAVTCEEQCSRGTFVRSRSTAMQ